MQFGLGDVVVAVHNESVRRRQLIVLLVMLVNAVPVSRAPAADTPRGLWYQFIEEVLLMPERGTNMKRCRRFLDSPSVCAYGAREHERDFDEAVKVVNEALAPTKLQLRTNLHSPLNAQVKCFFATGTADYIHIREYYHLRSPPEQWVWEPAWDKDSRLTGGYILMNMEGCSSEQARYRSLRALLGAIGFNGWSSAIGDSIFSGQRQDLSDTDRRLIKFFYNHVRPNAQAWELRAAFDRHWND